MQLTGSLWTAAEENQLLAMRATGCQADEIAQALGRSRKSVYMKIERLAKNGIPSKRLQKPRTVPVEEMAAARAAAEARRGSETATSAPAEFRTCNGVDGPVPEAVRKAPLQSEDGPTIVQSGTPTIVGYVDPQTRAEKWQMAETDNEHRIEVAKAKRQFDIYFKEDWVLLTFMSDLHIAPGTPVDMRRMRLDAELIRDTPRCYCLLGGDMVDNHIKHRSAMLAARSQPQDQYEHFEYLLEIMGHKVVAAVAGNHDAWTDQFAGIDVLGSIIRRHGNTAYSNNEVRITAHVGAQHYKVAMRHQYRLNSSFNQTHAVKQWLRLGEEDFDIGGIAHHHEAAIENFIHAGKFRWAFRPGAYQITSHYSGQYGWNDAIPTCPTFLVCGDAHNIVGFADLRQALLVLNLCGKPPLQPQAD